MSKPVAYDIHDADLVDGRTSPCSVLRQLDNPQMLHNHDDHKRQSDPGPCNAEDPDVDCLIGGCAFGGEPVQECDAQPE
jgi:hypothetical protein